MIGIFKKLRSDRSITEAAIASAEAQIAQRLEPITEQAARDAAREVLNRRLEAEAQASRTPAQRARKKPREKVRSQQLNCRISREEQARIIAMQKRLNLSMADLLISALDALERGAS